MSGQKRANDQEERELRTSWRRALVEAAVGALVAAVAGGLVLSVMGQPWYHGAMVGAWTAVGLRVIPRIFVLRGARNGPRNR